MFCPSCGKELSEGAQFCRFCGVKMQATPVVVETTAPPPPLPVETPVVAPAAQSQPQAVQTPITPVAADPVAVAPVTVSPASPVAASSSATPPTGDVCLHCGFGMGGGIQFCGQCGKQAGTAPPPKPKKFCQGCGAELAEGLKFCQSCGHKVPGAGFSFPAGLTTSGTSSARAGAGAGANVNLSLDNVSGFLSGLPIGKQRLIMAVAALLGMLSPFLKWVSAKGAGVALNISAKGIDEGVGWLTFGIFVVVLVLCILGNRMEPMGKIKFAAVAVGAFGLFIGIMQFVALNENKALFNRMGVDAKIGFGVYLLLIASVCVGAIPFIKKLER